MRRRCDNTVDAVLIRRDEVGHRSNADVKAVERSDLNSARNDVDFLEHIEIDERAVEKRPNR